MNLDSLGLDFKIEIDEFQEDVVEPTFQQLASKITYAVQSAQEQIDRRWETYEHMANQEPAKFQMQIRSDPHRQ